MCPIEELTRSFNSEFKTEGLAKDKVLPELRIESGTPDLMSRMLSTKLSLLNLWSHTFENTA